jgi:hypothetical protein
MAFPAQSTFQIKIEYFSSPHENNNKKCAFAQAHTRSLRFRLNNQLSREYHGSADYLLLLFFFFNLYYFAAFIKATIWADDMR